MKKVLLTDPIAGAGLEILKAAGLEIIDHSGSGIADILDVIGGIHGWIIRSGTEVDAELLNQADNLQVIGRAGVGLDNIDLQVATLRGVVVMNTPDGNTVSAAEHTLALMMSLARNVHLGHSKMTSGQWDRNTLAGVEMQGKTMGIVGLGRIGRLVAGYARALGMQILGHDPYAPRDLLKSGEIELMSLEDLLGRADFVSLHVPKTDDTLNLIDASRLAMMKPSARLINCARGGVVDEIALVAALEAGTLAGAALDVYATEPLPGDHPLRSAPNVVLTPHLGASTREAQEGVALAICKQVADFLVKGELVGAVNMPVADMEVMKRLEPYLHISAIMGQLLWQLTDGNIRKIEVTCQGQVDNPELMALSAVRGVLDQILDSRLNFVNTAAVAQERGIGFTYSIDTAEGNYANLIRVDVTTGDGVRSMAGSIFGRRHARIVEIDGYHLELNPEGVMLFIRNRDAPGVLGRIGTVMGNAQVNIGEALLSRGRKSGDAYLVVKVDTDPPENVLRELGEIDGIIAIQKVMI